MKRPPRQGGTVASFYGLPLDSDRVVFVIDQSGSMSAADVRSRDGRTRLDTAKSEVLAAVGRLKDNDRINLILFETNIRPWKTKLAKLSAGVRSDLESHLKKQDPLGGTNLYDGLEAALLTKGVDTVFLLSDGVPGSGKYVHHADIVRAVRRLNQTRRITIHCVSVGMQSSLLRELAASNGGKYVQR